MFRLVCASPLFAFSAQNATATKYIIKQGAYLIEAPPKRPISGYALYVKDKCTGKKNMKVDEAAEELSKKWKLYPELQEQYKNQAKQQNQGYDKIKEEYENKYVVPFKKISAHNLRFSQTFKNNNFDTSKGIRHVGDQMKNALKATRTLEDDKRLQEEAKKIRDEREALKKNFEFPQLLTPTFQSFLVRNHLPKHQRGPTYQEDMKKAYEAEKAKWKESLKKWLEEKKYNLTVEEFEKLLEKYRKEQKAKREGDNDY